MKRFTENLLSHNDQDLSNQFEDYLIELSDKFGNNFKYDTFTNSSPHFGFSVEILSDDCFNLISDIEFIIGVVKKCCNRCKNWCELTNFSNHESSRKYNKITISFKKII